MDDLSRDIKANERKEPETAVEFDVNRAPMSPLKAAKTELVGPDSRKDDDPFPFDSTSAPALAMFSAVALVWPQINKVSNPEACIRGKNIECARGSTEIVAGTSICIACELVALGGGGGDADTVAESDARIIGALEVGGPL